MRPLADLLPHNQEQVKETLARQRELAEKRRNDFLPTSQCTKPKKKTNEECPICKGQVLYMLQYPNGRMEMQTCPNCADTSKTSGLSETGIINLEKALRAHDRLGGHIVSGHVDGIGKVTHFAEVGESWELRIQAPLELAKYMAYKGSITVNGVSLTVNRVQDLADGKGCEISINLIPHTVENTALGQLRQGSSVNLEIDLIARYVERMLQDTGKNQNK